MNSFAFKHDIGKEYYYIPRYDFCPKNFLKITGVKVDINGVLTYTTSESQYMNPYEDELFKSLDEAKHQGVKNLKKFYNKTMEEINNFLEEKF